MARMFPDRIPEPYAREPGRAAERRMFRTLEGSLSREFTVFGWVAWIARGFERAYDGETDFVVAHPDHGFLILEVKGGRISHDGESGRWVSVDRQGAEHEIRDPFGQAKGAKYALLRKLKSLPGWSERQVPAGHAVAFPDVKFDDAFGGTDRPREVTLFRDDLGALQSRVERVFEFWHREESHSGGGFGEEGVTALHRLVARSFTLPMPLGAVADEEERTVAELTERQFTLLDHLQRNRRMLITGAAGTGKTFLALEKAQRLAGEGFRTLLTCFNRPLAEFLRQSAGPRENLTIVNLSQLYHEWARRAGLPAVDPESPEADAQPQSYFQETLPQLFLDALDRLPERFDVLVVDEGQDFTRTDRAALECALADRSDPVVYVFEDEAQDIYRDRGGWSDGDMPQFQLTDNLRNTRRIHELMRRMAPDPDTQALGPPGVEPEFVLAATPPQRAAELSRAVHRLVREHDFAPEDIAVLTTSRRQIPELAPDGRIGAFQITRDETPQPDRVLVDSVPRFKGLEREAVVLVGLHETSYCKFDSILYVGASRARSHLVVIYRPEVLERFGWRPPCA